MSGSRGLMGVLIAVAIGFEGVATSSGKPTFEIAPKYSEK
jgi:hypothetical protein